MLAGAKMLDAGQEAASFDPAGIQHLPGFEVSSIFLRPASSIFVGSVEKTVAAKMLDAGCWSGSGIFRSGRHPASPGFEVSSIFLRPASSI
jgi:hypothetical protein